MATYAGVLAGCLGGLGAEVTVLGAGRALPRAGRWAAAAWPGAWPMRGAPDVFRMAQVHFDLYGRPLVLRGRGRPDVMHWTYPLPLRVAGRANVVTVHDLIPLLAPALTGIEPRRFRRLLRAVLEGAAHVVTVSAATKRELVSALGVAEERVTDTGQAVDVRGAVAAGVEGLVRGEYWLHVGAVERRKNLVRLIAAWQASGTRRPLVLAGPDGWQAGEALAAAAPFLGGGGIVRVPWLERDRLLGLVRDARGLVMPSLAEGFGLPVAEAMALGTPVLCSDRGALAEVGGEAAVLVDPLDVRAMAAGLRYLDGDAGVRQARGGAGRVWAERFGVEAYAERLAGVYRTVRSRGA